MLPFLCDMTKVNGKIVHTSAGNTYSITIQPDDFIQVEFDEGVFGSVTNMRDLIKHIESDKDAFNEMMRIWDMVVRNNVSQLIFIERDTHNGPLWGSLMEDVAECSTHNEFRLKHYATLFDDFPPI